MHRLYKRATSSARRHNNRGQHLVELAAGLILIIPVFMLLIDLVFIYQAVQVNDSAARDAARAASQLQPDPSAAAGDSVVAPGTPMYTRAQAVVRQMYGTSASPPQITQMRLTAMTRPDPQLGGLFGGQLTARTQAQINPPVAIPLLNSFLSFNHSAEATFPLTASANATVIPP